MRENRTTLSHSDARLETHRNPLPVAFIQVSSEMTFILNSARLLPSRFPRTH